MFFFSNAISQNLIQNGSFENYTGIDCIYGGFTNNSPPNNHVVDNWYELNSCDYFNSVCTNTYTVVPKNVFGNQAPKSGNSYVGFILFAANGDMKEYIYQQLSAPLQAGKMYCLSFYVSRADGITHAIHSIGAYLSVLTPTLYSNLYVNKTPQIINQNSYVTDSLGWTQIQGCFTASGSEQYITIGNFNSNANTDTLFVGSNNPTFGAYKYAYYYIDDITLIDQTTVGINELRNGNSVSVYPNPANDIVNFQFSNTIEKRKIELYDAIGNLVLEKDASSNNLSLTTENLSNGIYFYSVKHNNVVLKQDKIVIIK